MRTDELIEQIEARAEDARRVTEAAEKRGWTGEDRQLVERLLGEAGELKGRLDDERKGGSLRDQLNELAAEIGSSRDDGPPSNGRAQIARRSSLGDAFTASDQYQALRRQYPEGRIPERARVNMDPVSFKQDIVGEPGLVAIGREDGGYQGLIPPDYQGLVDMLGRPELRMRGLFSRRATTSDLVEYVVQLTRANAADWVAEASDLDPTAFPSGETGIKPMGGFTFETRTAAVAALAEWIPITKRAVMDAAQLRGVIDQELRDDLRDAEERALLYGGGPAGEIVGLDDTEGVQVQDFDTDIFVTTRRARSLVVYGGFATPTAYLVNVEDAERLDLERDQVGRFFSNGPYGLGPATLWGLPRIESPYVREGEAWLADWSRGVIWDRQQATISVSDSHADFFIRNLLAVLGEQREAFGIIRPAAFVKIATK